MIELLPCPFCGSNEVELWVNFDETTDKEREVELYSADGEYPEYSMYEVNCDGCNFALGHFMHPSHVVDKWNARIATAEVTPYREALRALGEALRSVDGCEASSCGQCEKITRKALADAAALLTEV
jgi:hypothetical protein